MSFPIKQLFTAAAALLLLSSCQKSGSGDGSDDGSPKGKSKIIVDTYLDTTGIRLTQNPLSLCLDNSGTLYVAQHEGIYRIDPTTHQPSLLIGGEQLAFPENIWFHNNEILAGDYATGKPVSIDMSGHLADIPYDNPSSLNMDALGTVVDKAGNYIIADPGGMYEIAADTHTLTEIGTHAVGHLADGTYQTATFGEITGITADANGIVYIADAHRIRKLDGMNVTTISGGDNLGSDDGSATTATYGGAMTICPSGDGGLYIADYNSNRVRKMNADGSVTSIAGMDKQGWVDGPADIAEFYQPSGIVYSPAGHGVIYVSDYSNKTIRRISFP